MRYFLFVLFSLLIFSVSTPVFAANTIVTVNPVPSAHCLSNKPCERSVVPVGTTNSVVPSGSVMNGQQKPSQAASFSAPSPIPGNNTNATTGTPSTNNGAACENLTQIINKLTNTGASAANAKVHIKCHGGGDNGGGNNNGINPNNGAISKFIALLLELLLKLLNLCGIQQPVTGTPVPSVSPSIMPTLTVMPSGAAVTVGAPVNTTPSIGAGGVTPPGTTGSGTGLTVSGVSVMQGNTRFIFKGVNLEYFRDPGGASISNAEVPIASQIVAKMKSVGINAVRLDYTPAFVNQGNNMTNYLAMVKLLASNGIYVMPSDHSYTGKPISGYTTTSFPDFKTIIDYAQQQGITNYLIMNPYNEPYSSDDEQSWIAANEATLQYFRTTLGFKGVVVLDTASYATTDNTSTFQTMMSYDASLLGGKANIVFSNHWYPTYTYQPTLTLAKQYPLVIGEIGQTVAGPTNPSYVTQVFQGLISTGIPNGHNGAFPWIWWWTDGNQMTDDGLTLNTFGQLLVSDFYSKVTN